MTSRPAASPWLPSSNALPDLAHSSAHIYFGGAPRFTYCYAPASDLHTIRIDARRFGAAIAITDDAEAWRLVADLEFVARELRRRLDLPAAPAPSQP